MSAQQPSDLPVALSAPVAGWFRRRFGTPTDPQRLGWPAIAHGEDTLIAAPTGSGKTLAAFLTVIDRLVRRGLEGRLEDRLEAVYVSPLRALSHDIHRNLEAPLAEIGEEAERLGLTLPEIRVAVRTGDTPAAERAGMLRRPPHVLVTTPESLYLLLTAERSRALLRDTRTLILDEIHALARDKRGSHLALSVARLEALASRRVARIGLSATQRPIDLLARFLVGTHASHADGTPACTTIDLGHQRDLDLAVEVPAKEDLHAVAPTEQWDDLLDGIAAQIRRHRTTLVFVNTRRLAERVAHRLGERLGADRVAAHHGSLSRARRLRVEDRLRSGDLAALVATASLELGIDIGRIDLVCQIGSPRGIATFLQRVGRAGHALGLRPRGRLFPTSRDELIECAALARAVRAGRLDRIEPPVAPLDVLAQQIVAACAAEERDEDALYALMCQAAPYATLTRADFDAVLDMLATGFETPRGRRGRLLHRDRMRGRVRARRGARLLALLSGGAIPETGDYRVLLDPGDTLLGTVNEDWAVESMPGDVFVLGSHSWRIRRIEAGVVRVTDAEGAPPTLPFWLGEAPARSDELSEEVSALRAKTVEALDGDLEAAARWLEGACLLDPAGARQLARYVQVQLESTGIVPTRRELLVERFFDEAGGMQLVVHAPYGARVNRGLGLALRKRLCRSFNQELQAAATDDAVVLSLGSPQTFPLESLGRFLSSTNVADVLAQAMLASPLFTARWRWNATRALAVPRSRGSKRVPFPIQRMEADDLLGAAFPDQVACQENVAYPLEIPDHPLVRQTLHDCLHEAADLTRLTRLLAAIEAGEVRLCLLDSVEPSPFSHEVLNAKPYAFLDDAPLEERRTRAVALRHVLPEASRPLAELDPEAIARVRDEARPVLGSPDDVLELLVDLLLVPPAELGGGREFLEALRESGRIGLLHAPDGVARVFAAERGGEARALLPDAPIELEPAPAGWDEDDPPDVEQLRDDAVRGHVGVLGPTTPTELTRRLGLSARAVEASLVRLEARGIVLRGRFDPALGPAQTCDRALLARIHRYTLARLRRAIEPVSALVFARFLLRWQHVDPESRCAGESGLLAVIEKLAGFEAPVAVWESALLPARVEGYRPELLDRLCLGGHVAWARLSSPDVEARSRPSRATPIALFPRAELDTLVGPAAHAQPGLRAEGRRVLELLRARGALFARELERATGLLPVQVEEGLRELVARGLVTCDGFAPLRRLLDRRPRRDPQRRRRLRVTPKGVVTPEGRWDLLQPGGAPLDEDEAAERQAWRLLRRTGVVFRELLVRETLPRGWRPVQHALRRLEARGLVRGGRFVTGFVGEQFALPEVIPRLRAERTRAPAAEEIRIAATDPLNLAGILTPGPRVPAVPQRALLLRDGLPVAVLERGRRIPLAGGSEPANARW